MRNARGKRWPEKEAKPFFSFHILLDKRIWVHIIKLLKPKLLVLALWKIAKSELNYHPPNSNKAIKIEHSPNICLVSCS